MIIRVSSRLDGSREIKQVNLWGRDFYLIPVKSKYIVVPLVIGISRNWAERILRGVEHVGEIKD